MNAATELMVLTGCVFITSLLLVSFAFLLGYRLRRYDIIDTFWGILFINITLGGLWWSDKNGVQLFVAFLVTLWGLRLATHIGSRFLRSKSEDARYVELRKKWRGNQVTNTYFRIYVVQSVLAVIVALPVLVVMTHEQSSQSRASLAVLIGGAIWVIGFVVQVIADRQLREFIRTTQNKNSLLQTGLWRYSRHPNYFGEIFMWWGIALTAYIATSLVWVFIGPLAITYLITRVSGIPPSERRMSKKPGWERYKAQTSVLIPLPKRTYSR